MGITEHTAAANRAVAMTLPMHDRRDFDDARRGFVTSLDEVIVRATDGRVVWDLDAYGSFDGDAPDTVHPSLWRQAQLNLIHGLFEVVPSVYQVRGLDLSNMTIIEGDTGVIVIDPLISSETAAASLELYRSVRGDRPVTAVIYTHSHVDHFGGVRGVLPGGQAGDIPIVAPEHFVEHALSENIYAGTAMTRRATYMYGALLPKGPEGQVTAGLGPTTSVGTVGLVPPTIDIGRTGEELVLDGVRIVFQMTPGTEAPAEMNFHFPDLRLLCMAENATHNLHNVVTLRGAQVRDARAWSRFLDESLELFGAGTDTVFASHHWPTWGADRVVTHLSNQRDLYGYLHDQTLRLMNHGLTGPEIAEEVELPPALDQSWDCRGYYGSVSHNVKADLPAVHGLVRRQPGQPLAPPARARGPRYVEFMGGTEAVLDRAQRSFDEGDYRWVAEVVNHVIFADPTNRRGPRAAGPHVRAARLRRRERHVAELLPHGRPGAARRRGPHRGQRQLARHGEPAHGAADVRRGGRAGRRPGGDRHRARRQRHRHRRRPAVRAAPAQLGAHPPRAAATTTPPPSPWPCPASPCCRWWSAWPPWPTSPPPARPRSTAM